jgi:hypothetical protein
VGIVLSFDISELLLKGRNRIATPLMQYSALPEFALQGLSPRCFPPSWRKNLAAAHALLAPLYGWFTEELDTLDLQEAQALHDALRGSPSP